MSKLNWIDCIWMIVSDRVPRRIKHIICEILGVRIKCNFVVRHIFWKAKFSAKLKEDCYLKRFKWMTFMSKNVIHCIGDLVFSNLIVFILLCRIKYGSQKKMSWGKKDNVGKKFRNWWTKEIWFQRFQHMQWTFR